MQYIFEYPHNYISREREVETDADALLLSNDNISSGVELSSVGSVGSVTTDTVHFTIGPIDSEDKIITHLYVISKGISEITWTGNANSIKKIREDSDRQPISTEFFFKESGNKDYSLISLSSTINNALTISFLHATSGVIYEVYLLRLIGTFEKIEDVRYGPPDKRNEYVREGFYGSLSKQRVANVRNKREISYIARGTRVQIESLERLADKERLTFAANVYLEPTLVFPAIIELEGPRRHVAEWQSDLFRMPYRVREI